MRFAVYARRSTDDEGESVDSQLKACRELADRRSFTVLDNWIVSEEDVSGRISREGLDKIIKGAYRKPRPFDALMIWAISRGARDMGLTLELFESMEANNIQIWRADQGREIPFKTPQDKMMVMVEAYGATDQPYQSGRAVHRSHRQRAARGWQVAGREFGYDLLRFCNCGTKDCPERGDDHKGHTERRVNKQQAAIIVKIFQLSADGMGDGRIVAKVMHLDAPGEKGWSKEAVKRILCREIYRGWIHWGKTQRHVVRSEAGKKVYARSTVPASEWVREYHPELHIVSDELWNRVRRRKAKTLQLYGNNKTLEKGDSGVNISTSMLGSIAKCGLCKGSLALFKDRGKAHYRCRTRYRTHKCSNSSGVPAKILEQAVRSAVREALRDPKNIAALEQTLKVQGERWLRERRGNAKQHGGRSSLEQGAKKLRLIVERLNDAIERGRPVDKRLEQRTAELAQLEAKLKAPAPSKLTRAQITEKLNAALEPLERMKKDYKEAKAEMAQEVRDALRALGIERVVVTPLGKGGWRIDGGANLELTIGSSGGSAATMPARYTVSP